MEEKKLWNITIDGETRTYPDGTTFEEIAKELAEEKHFETPPLLAVFDGSLKELCRKPHCDGKLKLLTYTDVNGYRAYRRSAVFLLQRAINTVFAAEQMPVDIEVKYSLGPGYYCRMEDRRKLTAAELTKIKEEMERLVEADLPLKKYSMKTDEARRMFRAQGMYDKDRLLRYRNSSNINIYELDGLCDYFYGYMVPSTGYIKYFDLHLYDEGFVLQFPDRKNPSVLVPYEPANKLFQVLKLANEWSETMEVPTVGALNDAIAHGRGGELVLMQEALMEARIAALAQEIGRDERKKFVMIAGPSSSGKTTFAHRLSTQLAAQGLHPHPLSLDNYYLNHDQMPLDEFGEKDFESIEGLDLPLFNSDMEKLLNGERVLLPVFNFTTGKREYHENYMQLNENDILVIEGIHGLNERMSASLPKENKYKIYISALTQLSIDEHNPLSTTDDRLIRRIVRDARTRGTIAKDTIAMWDSVRRGETNYIFPFQEQADAMFNSALIYEMSVLKQYAQPQLYAIEKDCPEYAEAKRLLKFLDYFLPIPSELIAPNSLVREFIGGSCFHV